MRKIELLAKSHDRDGFDCGSEPLNLFLRDHQAKRYYEQFGFVSLPSNELELFLQVKTIQEALTPHQ